MQQAIPLLPGPHIRLRAERFDTRLAELGLPSDRAAAQHIGVDPATLSRIRNGEGLPGERFIAACLASGFASSFGDLFEIATDTEAS